MDKLELLRSVIKDTKLSVNKDNAKIFYDVYIEMINNMKDCWNYISDIDIYDPNIKLNTISGSKEGKAERIIVNNILQDDGVFLQPIWGARSNDNKIVIFDGVHRFISLETRMRESLFIILNNHIHQSYIRLQVPKYIGSILLSLNKLDRGSNSFIIEENDLFCIIQAKGMIIIDLIIYWSKYIDEVYNLYMKEDILISIPTFINNRE